MIIENEVKLDFELPSSVVNKKMDIFYNPKMVSNRNISLTLLKCLKLKKIALPLAGSGVRGLRILKTIPKVEVYFNDFDKNFLNNINQSLILNKIETNYKLFNQDATLFLLNNEGFDYIDIDPFGTPNPFLAAAVARISRDGVLAITATDTAALTGTYPKVTKRKYWAKSKKTYLMHETGLRTLIRKVQLQGIQFDKALTPILAYSKDHYYRVYFQVAKGKEKCDKIISEHQYLTLNDLEIKLSPEQGEIGPLWTGSLIDKKIIKCLVKNNIYPEEQKFLETLQEEEKINKVGFYDFNIICKKIKKQVPKMILLKELSAVRTHFSLTGFKTEKNIKEIIKKI
jgi:tRNA (guanine26-N2/guanine27-N2)-dimethyltransferase